MLLVCQRPGLLPRTILSRCVQLPLAPLPEAELAAALARLAPEIPPERRAVLAGLGRGLARPGPGAGGRRLARTLRRPAAQARRRPASATGGPPRPRRRARARAADGRGLPHRRRPARPSPSAALAALQAGQHARAWSCSRASCGLLDRLAAGLGLDQWVAVWDKLTALAGQVDRLNLDPVQALLQVVQAICGAAPETELSLA